MRNEVTENVIIGVVVGCMVVIAARLTWPYISPWWKDIISHINLEHTCSTSESQKLVNYKNTISLAPEMLNTILEDQRNMSFQVTINMIASLKILGIYSTLGETLSLNQIKAEYRKKLQETHPDKTHINSEEKFIQVREAFQAILREVVNVSNNGESVNFIASIALNELFSIFIVKNLAIENQLNAEKQYWVTLSDKYHSFLDQTYQEKIILSQKHDNLISQQAAFFSKGTAYCTAVDLLADRANKLKQENNALNDILIKIQSDNSNEKASSFLCYQSNFSETDVHKINSDSSNRNEV